MIGEQVLRLFWDHVPVACAVVLPDGRFERVNPFWEEMTGYSSVELEKRTWMSITLQDDVQSDKDMAAQVLTGERGSYTIDKTYIRKPPKNGLQPVRLTVYGLRDAEGKVSKLLSIAKPKEPKAVVEDTQNGVTITAHESGLKIGKFDWKHVAMGAALIVQLAGWIGTGLYAIHRLESLEHSKEQQDAQIRALNEALLRKGNG